MLEAPAMDYLLPYWNLRISFWLTAATGVLLLWQYLGAKGTGGHVVRWATAFGLSIFVVYMNTQSVMSQPRVVITNPWHMHFMAFHQNVGLVYFALMAVMPLLGVTLIAAARWRWRGRGLLHAVHKWTGYAAGICWLCSNIASEIGTRIPRT
jgi:hypothetical protein